MKRNRARLLWITITNGAVFAFSLYVLIGVYSADIRINIDHLPPPTLWAVFCDNPYFGLSLILAGAGFLLETVNRREAAFINCGLWIALSINAIAHKEPEFSTALVVGVLAVDTIWYAISAKRKTEISASFKTSE